MSNHPCGCNARQAGTPQCYVCDLKDEILEGQEKLKLALRQRDLAIAHDTQPYPTAQAYGLVCKARDALQAKLECAREALEHISGNRGKLQECCRAAFHRDDLDNHDSDVASIALEKLGAPATRTPDTHELTLLRNLATSVKNVTELCDFTEFGGEAQDAFREMEQSLDDLETAYDEKEYEDGKA